MTTSKFRNAHDSLDTIFKESCIPEYKLYVFDALNKISISLVEYRMRHKLSQLDIANLLRLPVEAIQQVEEGDGSAGFEATMAVLGYLWNTDCEVEQ